ncbi:hypothetical protein HFN89_03380 [Rhizobium laguerreae]|nr:hypothetical protein [Rhizobium laguerreae]
MSANITFGRYRHQELNGYVVANLNNGVTNAVMVALDPEGRLSAASLSTQGEIDGDDVQWTPLESRACGQWAYSMMTGEHSSALLDMLDVPHVDRPAVAADLFAEAAARAAEFLPGLNRDALAAMAKAPEKRLSTYEFYAADGERGLYRRQAAVAYGVFADLLNANLSTKMAIDRKKPLTEILLPILSEMAERPIGNALLKRFAQAPALPEGMRLGPILVFASHVQPDWFPKSAEEWKSFYHVAYAVMEDLQVPPQSLSALLAGSGGKWTELVERAVAKAYVNEGDPALSDPDTYVRIAAFNARDTLESFVDMVVLPLIAHAQEADDVFLNASIRKGAAQWAWDMLFEGRNLPDLLDVSRRFHQERPAMLEMSERYRNAQAKSQIKEGGWPGLTGTVQAPNGLWLVPLCTTEELKQEGQRMHHCVGGYTSQAKACNSHIVSVRTIHADGSSESHSTAEFRGIKQAIPDKLGEVQHQAHYNHTPAAIYRDAMNWYVRQIESGRLKTNWELIRAFLDDKLVVVDQVERLCGYDWRERENLDMAVRPWGAFVTKPYRTKGLDALMDSDQAAAIIEGMTPAFLSAAPTPAP